MALPRYSIVHVLACVCFLLAMELPLAHYIQIIQEPKTDKNCYQIWDNGTLTFIFNVTNVSIPLDQLTVWWNSDQSGKGTWHIQGSSLFVHGWTRDNFTQDPRWQLSYTYINRTVHCRIDVRGIKPKDETLPLYAFVKNRSSTEETLAKSKTGAHFNVPENCPSTEAASTQQTPPKVKTSKNESMGRPSPKETFDLITKMYMRLKGISIRVATILLYPFILLSLAIPIFHLFCPACYDSLRERSRYTWSMCWRRLNKCWRRLRNAREPNQQREEYMYQQPKSQDFVNMQN